MFSGLIEPSSPTRNYVFFLNTVNKTKCNITFGAFLIHAVEECNSESLCCISVLISDEKFHIWQEVSSRVTLLFSKDNFLFSKINSLQISTTYMLW